MPDKSFTSQGSFELQLPAFVPAPFSQQPQHTAITTSSGTYLRSLVPPQTRRRWIEHYSGVVSVQSPAEQQGTSLTRTMSGPTKYMLVSLPTSISPSSDKEEAFTALRSTVSGDSIAVLPFKIPEFKIGTLDALVQQADDLAKLENACEGVVAKMGDSLKSLLEGDEDKIAQQKTVNDSMFAW